MSRRKNHGLPSLCGIWLKIANRDGQYVPKSSIDLFSFLMLLRSVATRLNEVKIFALPDEFYG